MTRRRAPRDRVVHTESWWCSTCKDGQEAEKTTTAFLAHLETVHGMGRPVKGSRTMMMHLDMADRYVSTYEWTFANRVRAVESITGPR
jgi:hypothetical protein